VGLSISSANRARTGFPPNHSTVFTKEMVLGITAGKSNVIQTVLLYDARSLP